MERGDCKSRVLVLAADLVQVDGLARFFARRHGSMVMMIVVVVVIAGRRNENGLDSAFASFWRRKE